MSNIPLDYLDDFPYEMRRYLKYYGWHFNRKAYEFAASLMWKKGPDGKKVKVDPLTKEQVDAMLAAAKVSIDNNGSLDYMYWAMQCKADLMPGAIDDAQHHAMYIKMMTDDPDVTDEAAFRTWYIKAVGSGIGVPFGEFLD